MALSGTLETFSLPDVLRLLATTNKTGLLTLDGDRGAGWLRIEDGDLVAAGADRSLVDDVDAVLFELLRFADASFEFDATAPAPGGPVGDRRDIEGALEVADRRLAEWHEIEAAVPSLDVRVRMVTEIDGEVSVTADAWRVLACIGPGASGYDVARHLDQGEYEVCSALHDLVERNLIDVDVDAEVDAEVDSGPATAVADAFAAMVSEPEPVPVPVYEVDELPVHHEGDEEPEAEVEQAGDDTAARDVGDDLDQNLLLRFLSSAKP